MLENLIQLAMSMSDFFLGLFLGYLIRHVSNGTIRNNKEALRDFGKSLVILAILGLWASAHVNNIFFSGPSVDFILNVIGGITVASAIQEKESLMRFVKIWRGGFSDKSNDDKK